MDRARLVPIRSTNGKRNDASSAPGTWCTSGAATPRHALPAVILSTNDDSINIYLSIYCRRLNPELRIISRLTSQSNVDAIHRAGSDFVISYSALGAESVLAFVQRRPLIMLGAGVEIIDAPVPGSIAGKRLADSGVGAKTGLNIIAVQRGESVVPNPPANHALPGDGRLLMLGTASQRSEFVRIFG